VTFTFTLCFFILFIIYKPYDKYHPITCKWRHIRWVEVHNDFQHQRKIRGGGDQHHAPAALPPSRRPGTHCTRGCVGPRSGLDVCVEKRISLTPLVFELRNRLACTNFPIPAMYTVGCWRQCGVCFW